MRNVYGELIAAHGVNNGTDITLHIHEDIAGILTRRNVREVQFGFDDGRTISPMQRRKIYAMLRDISDYTGYDPETAKQIFKIQHMERTGEEPFSLSDCSMTTARGYINTLMEYALREGIILTESGLRRTDDIDTYLIQCIRYRRCCICGRPADIHHIDTIGMGNNRREVDDLGKEIIALCRVHHTAAHSMGNARFEEMYKVYGIIKVRALPPQEGR